MMPLQINSKNYDNLNVINKCDFEILSFENKNNDNKL